MKATNKLLLFSIFFILTGAMWKYLDLPIPFAKPKPPVQSNKVCGPYFHQYPASLRTTIIRMMIKGVSADKLYFDPPSTFQCPATAQSICDTDDDINTAVFHLFSDDATCGPPPANAMAYNNSVKWIFSSAWEIKKIGTDAEGGAGNDIIAFAPNVLDTVCRSINDSIRIDVASGTDADGDGIPKGSAKDILPVTAHNMTKANPGFAAELDIINEPPFIGQGFGCYDTSDGNGVAGDGPFVYYHVLVER